MTRIQDFAPLPNLLDQKIGEFKKRDLVQDAKIPENVEKVAEEFESLFLGIVLKAMRDTVPDSGLMSKSNAMKIYTSMLDDEYSKILAANRHTGIAESIENFLKVQNQNLGKEAYLQNTK